MDLELRRNGNVFNDPSTSNLGNYGYFLNIHQPRNQRNLPKLGHIMALHSLHLLAMVDD